MRRPPVIFEVTGSLLVMVATGLLTFALTGCTVPRVDLMALGSGSHSRSLVPLPLEEAIVRQAIAEHEKRHP